MKTLINKRIKESKKLEMKKEHKKKREPSIISLLD